MRDIADVTLIYNIAAGIVPPPAPGDGDVDNDADIDFLDGDALVQFLVNGVPLP